MSANITTPEIYGLLEDSTGVTVDMEYIPFFDVKHVMITQDKATNDWLIDTAISVVDSELSDVTLHPLASVLPAFIRKSESIRTELARNPRGLMTTEELKTISRQVDAILYHFQQREHLLVPLGSCHGDLTFQNMLIDCTNRELCVFDFLDSFVESPLQDIAKLLQDCRHLWFLTQNDVHAEHCARIVTTLDLFYTRIRAAYCDYEMWELVPLFEFFCLARVLPYITNQHEKDCVLAGLSTVLKDLRCDSPQYQVCHTIADETEWIHGVDNKSVTMIIPAMGSQMAQRYGPRCIPKLLLPDQDGIPLIVRCFSRVGVANVKAIIIAVERALILETCGTESAFERLFDDHQTHRTKLLHFFYSDKPTRDVVETVLCAQSAYQVRGPIFIKDADNDFAVDVEPGNYLTLVDLASPRRSAEGTISSKHETPEISDATHKSYVAFNYDNIVSNLAYGSVFSSKFCCGGWGFLSAADFTAAASKVRSAVCLAQQLLKCNEAEGVESRLQVVDVVWHIITHGALVFGIEVDDYVDWGVPMMDKSGRNSPKMEVLKPSPSYKE
ncbi:DNA polymerase epsilon subunit B [Sphaceloma murrayae]|uniref:DNA polymerase epsilon subunit B n=1 Tax=Sphaceloma murrayae TaxID=2082308 RepID=A0A2K1QFD7_9PEZI|nr:DNA polymerase epsilon subunit B [Sphaceloma murrayae]